MNWEKTKIILEPLVVGKKTEVIFIPLEELPPISSMKSSCGCSMPRIIDNKVVVNYTPGSVPIHLQKTGFYRSSQKITITYKDNKQDILRFTAIVSKKTNV